MLWTVKIKENLMGYVNLRHPRLLPDTDTHGQINENNEILSKYSPFDRKPLVTLHNDPISADLRMMKEWMTFMRWKISVEQEREKDMEINLVKLNKAHISTIYKLAAHFVIDVRETVIRCFQFGWPATISDNNCEEEKRKQLSRQVARFHQIRQIERDFAAPAQ